MSCKILMAFGSSLTRTGKNEILHSIICEKLREIILPADALIYLCMHRQCQFHRRSEFLQHSNHYKVAIQIQLKILHCAASQTMPSSKRKSTTKKPTAKTKAKKHPPVQVIERVQFHSFFQRPPVLLNTTLIILPSMPLPSNQYLGRTPGWLLRFFNSGGYSLFWRFLECCVFWIFWLHLFGVFLVGWQAGWLDGFFSKSDVFLFSVINLVYSKPLFVFFPLSLTSLDNPFIRLTFLLPKDLFQVSSPLPAHTII